MRRMKAAPACATLGYVGLLSCSGIISRFGRQVRLGEHVDSGLTAYRHSEFATLDKMRLRYKTRLGRFITSPRRLAVLRLSPPSLQFSLLILGTDPVLREAPKSMLKNHHYSGISRGYHQNGKNENLMRNILGLTLLRLKKVRFSRVKRGSAPGRTRRIYASCGVSET